MEHGVEGVARSVADLVVVRRTDVWTAETMPAALRRDHRLASATWGRLHVVDGILRFVASTAPPTDVVLVAGDVQSIPPEVVHRVEPSAAARFLIEFRRERAAAVAPVE